MLKLIIKNVSFFLLAFILTVLVISWLFKINIAQYLKNSPGKTAPANEPKVGEQLIEIKTQSFNLPAKAADKNFGTDFNPKTVEYQIPADGYIQLIKTEISGAPGSVLHHADAYTKQEPILSLGREFLTGEANEIAQKLVSFGIVVKKNELITLETHFRNDDSQPYDNVSFKCTVRFVPSDKNVTPVKTFFFHINDPDRGGTEFYILPKSHYSKDANYIAPISGKLILIGAHVHDYGKYLRFSLNSKEIKTFVPQTNEKGQILRTASYYPQDNIYIKVGDKISLAVEYDNPDDYPAEGMGILALVIEPGK